MGAWTDDELRAIGAADEGRVEAGGVTREVRFEEVPVGEHVPGDAAYHAEYDRYPKAYVDPVVSPESWAATLRLLPA